MMIRSAAPRLLALLLAATVLAGCSGTPAQADAPTPSATPTATPSATPHAAASRTGFAIEGPVLTPLSATAEGLYEDDGVKVDYTVTQPATANGSSSFFVTYLFNKTIVSTDTVTLAPGQSKSFHYAYDNVTGMKEVTAEVRAGSSVAKANLTIKLWPRLGQDTSFDGLALKVKSVGIDATDNATVANVTWTRPSGQPLPVQDVHAKLLCADAKGNVTQKGDVAFALPEAGATAASDARFPPCADARGLVFTGVDVATGKHVMMHLLFPAGSVGTYTPPPPPAPEQPPLIPTV